MLTVNVFELPDSVPPVLVAVTTAPGPGSSSVTEWATSTPLEKFAVVVQPAEQFLFDEMSTVPVNAPTVPPDWSLAVTLMLKGTPAV